MKELVNGQLETRVIHGANLVENQYGPPEFADFFFFITGFHGFHVFSGVCLNFLIYYNTVTGVYQRRGHYEMVEKRTWLFAKIYLDILRRWKYKYW